MNNKVETVQPMRKHLSVQVTYTFLCDTNNK